MVTQYNFVYPRKSLPQCYPKERQSVAKAFTSKYLENIRPIEKRFEVPDPSLSGLYFIVQPSGVKSWALRYRFDGKTAKLTLGRWPKIGLAEARAAAGKAVNDLERGFDPSALRKAARSAKLDGVLLERDRIKTLVEQFDKRHLSGLKTGRVVRRELDRHMVVVWGDRDIQTISKRDVIDLLDTISDSGRKVTANRLRSYLNKFFNWCVDRDIIGQSPSLGVKPVATEKSRVRFLSDREIRTFWIACDELGYPWGHLGKTLLLTGQRLGEVAQMTDFELEGGKWHLSSERTKNGRAHDVPLSNEVRKILASIDRVDGEKKYLFTTNGKTALQGYYKGRNQIASRMVALLEEEIPHWTFHDLRRTAATGLARLGVSVRVTEAVLNHISGSAAGIVSVYQRHDYADEKAAALAKWASHIREITGVAQ